MPNKFLKGALDTAAFLAGGAAAVDLLDGWPPSLDRSARTWNIMPTKKQTHQHYRLMKGTSGAATTSAPSGAEDMELLGCASASPGVFGGLEA